MQTQAVGEPARAISYSKPPAIAETRESALPTVTLTSPAHLTCCHRLGVTATERLGEAHRYGIHACLSSHPLTSQPTAGYTVAPNMRCLDDRRRSRNSSPWHSVALQEQHVSPRRHHVSKAVSKYQMAILLRNLPSMNHFAHSGTGCFQSYNRTSPCRQL